MDNAFKHMNFIKNGSYNNMEYTLYECDGMFFGVVTNDLEYPIRIRFTSDLETCVRRLHKKIDSYYDEERERNSYKRILSEKLMFRTT